MSRNIVAEIDGPLFRQQRELLIQLADPASSGQPVTFTERDRELLEGLLDLTDAIADEAHDQYDIDCLLS